MVKACSCNWIGMLPCHTKLCDINLYGTHLYCISSYCLWFVVWHDLDLKKKDHLKNIMTHGCSFQHTNNVWCGSLSLSLLLLFQKKGHCLFSSLNFFHQSDTSSLWNSEFSSKLLYLPFFQIWPREDNKETKWSIHIPLPPILKTSALGKQSE